MRSLRRTPRQQAIRSLWFRAIIMLGALVMTTGLLSQSASAGKTLRPFGESGRTKLPPEGVVNINEATANQLSFLPRIGLKKAERIVRYRLRKPFRLVGHLARVKGIGRKTVRSLRPWLRLRGPTTMKNHVKGKPKRR